MNRFSITASKKLLFIIAFLAFLLSIAFVFYVTPRADAEPITASFSLVSESVPAETIGVPVNLRIPKLGIDVALGTIGITAKGALDAPKGPAEAAWYRLGPRPGEIGSAVIDGHSGWKNGIHAMFDELDMLEVGDRIYVQDDQGSVLTFEVREMKRLGEDDLPIGVFDSNDSLAHLNLITCEGIWSKTRKSYSQRLVVLTDRIYE